MQRFSPGPARHPRGIAQLKAIGRAYVAFSRELQVYFPVLARCALRAPTDGKPDSNAGECARLLGGLGQLRGPCDGMHGRRDSYGALYRFSARAVLPQLTLVGDDARAAAVDH